MIVSCHAAKLTNLILSCNTMLVKNQEARGKNQEARGKNQEARGKNQEVRARNQDGRK